ncbi:hypothetical protein [Paenibacillus sp. PAMC21692]|uniref:hypothetical protein n=1 Tax=Paenibacillus sp. PAMC21692 TaxID=2762320 RepID=UPI00164CF6A2|nr:hypothetical protein [Paenibacillus sp. PAMC21692]QNK58552.1 hypothetical protein H7F31_06500 [Paenibacillus sp. PAMC21692]
MKRSYVLTDEIIFDAKPDAVPFNYRISYKIAQLILILEFTARGGCSLMKLQMISTALSTTSDREKLWEFANNNTNSYTVVRFDPAVNRAVKYAIAEGLLTQQKNGLFRLAKKGKEFMKIIMKDPNLLSSEKKYLFLLSNKLTEEKIKELTSFWRYTNDKDK